jgi:hypothetical protein
MPIPSLIRENSVGKLHKIITMLLQEVYERSPIVVVLISAENRPDTLSPA